MAETREDYEKLIEIKRGIEQELDIPRCHNCLMNTAGMCSIYRQEIPDEHRFKYSDCKLWESDIPF